MAKATGVPLRELEMLNPKLKGIWLKAGTKVKIPKQEVASKPRQEEAKQRGNVILFIDEIHTVVVAFKVSLLDLFLKAL